MAYRLNRTVYLSSLRVDTRFGLGAHKDADILLPSCMVNTLARD